MIASRSVGGVQLVTSVAATGESSRGVDALLVTAAVVLAALIDVHTIQARATHQFHAQTWSTHVVLDAEPDVASLDGQGEIQDGQRGLQDAEFHGSAIGIGIILEHIRQIIGVLQTHGRTKGHIAIGTLHGHGAEATENGGCLEVNEDPVGSRLRGATAPTIRVQSQLRLAVSRLTDRSADAVIRNASITQSQIRNWPALSCGRKSGSALAVEGAIGVLALGGGQIALGGTALIDVLASLHRMILLPISLYPLKHCTLASSPKR